MLNDSYFSTRMMRMKASEIRELLKLLDQPEVISFAGGIPDPTLFPVDKFRDALTDALSEQTQADSLQYSPSEGYQPLRQWIAERMTGLGVACDSDNILITSGAQQALDYLGKLFLSPRDTVVLGWPTYLGALGAFNAYEPRFERLDPMGNRPAQDLLAEAEAAGGRVKFAYLSPDFANPTGLSLTLQERQTLLDQAEALDCAVIEDAAYQGLRFDGEELPPILALELARTGSLERCRTVYCGSFSKTLSPGLRVGWVCAAKPVIRKLVLLKQAGDLHCATLNQMAVAQVAQDGFDAHVARLNESYRSRRDAMLAALQRHMPQGVSWTRPEGGMFIWLTLPRGMDAAALLQLALQQRQHQVAFVPGAAFHPDGSGANTLRLSFSNSPPSQIDAGISRLGSAINCLFSVG